MRTAEEQQIMFNTHKECDENLAIIAEEFWDETSAV
jgi:hypothetical protein